MEATVARLTEGLVGKGKEPLRILNVGFGLGIVSSKSLL